MNQGMLFQGPCKGCNDERFVVIDGETVGCPLCGPPDDEAREIRRLGGDKNGSLLPADLPKLNDSRRAVLNILADGRPHSTQEITRTAGVCDPMRRLRELARMGFKIHRWRPSDASMGWQYQLICYEPPASSVARKR